ncbi:hypothetical protein NDU88_001389 [Pleurodeles waltl]|uniref:Uncharacterized protein n=1 Tax=Pleurodeles waltl TaxID=8319 RepID=A0AAV7NEL6_PLEWA|nr:hypothetical protein NDU88_001389 [Pleurodeles waltl]
MESGDGVFAAEEEQRLEDRLLCSTSLESGNPWNFIHSDMEGVDMHALPSATIACNLSGRLFLDSLCRVSAAGLPAPFFLGVGRTGSVCIAFWSLC